MCFLQEKREGPATPLWFRMETHKSPFYRADVDLGVIQLGSEL